MNKPAFKKNQFSRRKFLVSSGLFGGSFMFPSGSMAFGNTHAEDAFPAMPAENGMVPGDQVPDLSPARWIWYPSGRTLQNTFVLFRKSLDIPQPPQHARGWILADSRYLLTVNGQRVQWGPAPCDPRWLEADPADLTGMLHPGENLLGVQVLFYGSGEGTWPAGAPGLIFFLEMEFPGGRKETIISDKSWKTHVARAWRPGQYKRWFLRTLQEEFDARKYPLKWQFSGFNPDHSWVDAMELNLPASKPPIVSGRGTYIYGGIRYSGEGVIRKRVIPAMQETEIPVKALSESFWVEWQQPVADYFDFDSGEIYSVIPDMDIREGEESWKIQMDGSRGAALSFELKEQMVGWPYFSIEAPEGTTVELMVQEAHEKGTLTLLNNTGHHRWARFICREGMNRFEAFDYESCRWIQLHIHQCNGPVTISGVGMRRRVYPWREGPSIRFGDASLQRLMEATVNTLKNCAQETLMDGAGRERAQYSGDVSHQMHALYYGFGETRQLARFIRTYGKGITKEGYFLDTWPGYDRLARLWERQLELTNWGPILDHGVGFVFDCHHYYMYTGDEETLQEVFPNLVRFARYLVSIMGEDNLLPVEDLGTPSVWIDHDAYRQQRHKQCAFNLYVSAMLSHAFIPLCEAMKRKEWVPKATDAADKIKKGVIRNFWSDQHQTFINNLPWLQEEGSLRMCDRSLATAILYGMCPRNVTAPSAELLAGNPPEMGLSFPANAGWRLWALSRAGKTDVVIRELRQRWATMESVTRNNTISEGWDPRPDTGDQWSHCAVVPVYVLFMDVVGLRPLTAGYTHFEIRPRLADIGELECTAYPAAGPVYFKTGGNMGDRKLEIQIPGGCSGELVVDAREKLTLEAGDHQPEQSFTRYRLPNQKKVKLHLQYT